MVAAPLPSLGLALDEAWPAGLFTVTGQDASLRVNRLLAAEYGEFTLTGQDATLTEVTAQTPVYAAPIPPLSFLELSTAGQYVLTCEPGLFAVAGQAAALTKSKQLVCEFGSFVVSGAPAVRDLQITAERGTFVEFGIDAQLGLAPRTLTAAYAGFTVTGFDATLTYETVGERVLNCEYGRFNMSRSDQQSATEIDMTVTRVLTCEHGTFTINGQNATLTGPRWSEVTEGSGTWVYVTPSGGVWTDVDPDS
jgi:hypothetical protein